MKHRWIVALVPLLIGCTGSPQTTDNPAATTQAAIPSVTPIAAGSAAPTTLPTPTLVPTDAPPASIAPQPSATAQPVAQPTTQPVVQPTAPTTDVETAIARIRERYQTINAAQPTYATSSYPLPGESAEGSALTAYQNNGQIMKLVREVFGELGRTREEYYYWDDQLFFVFRKEDTYDQPFGNVASSIEQRSYFDNARLIRWRDNGQREVVASDPAFLPHEREVLARSGELRQIVAANPNGVASQSDDLPPVLGERILNLGNNGSQLFTFRIGGDGGIRILDGANRQLRIFTPDGGSERTIDLPESRLPIDFSFDANNNLYVLDIPGEAQPTPMTVLHYRTDGTLTGKIAIDPSIYASALVTNVNGDVALSQPDLDYGEVYWMIRRDGVNIAPNDQDAAFDEGVVSPRSTWVFRTMINSLSGGKDIYANPIGKTETGQLLATLPADMSFFNIDRAMNMYATTSIPDGVNGSITVHRLDPQGNVIARTRLDTSECSSGLTDRRFYVDQPGTVWAMCEAGGRTIMTRFRLTDSNGQPLPDVPREPAAAPYRP